MKNAKLSRLGFTLVELLVVVLIIGILAAVAVPQYQKAVMRTRLNNLKPLVNSIAQAQNRYMMENGKYAESFEELDIQMPAGKKSWSSDEKYLYDWGVCSLDVSGSGEWFASYCYHGSIGYMHYNDLSSRVCLVQNTDKQNSLEAKVCQADTGNTTYTQYFGYFYKN